MSATTRASWQAAVAPYIGADVRRSLFQLVTTLSLLVASYFATYQASLRSPWLAAPFLLLTAGFLVRSFILMHDCTHGSFLPWRRANDAVGIVTGLLALTPYDQWRRDHAIHHASSGDLDRRGHGDVTTWTVREYLARSRGQRLGYRLARHPVFLLMGGPVYLTYSQRFRARSKATRDRQIASVWGTNVAIAASLVLLVLLGGWRALAIYAMAYYIAAASGVWLFYVQHQFEDAYWEGHPDWDYETSAMKGSSHLQLPAILRWFTGSIGFHHVHHLAPRIPNYRLKRCHDENPRLQAAPVVTIASGVAALRLALWDEERRRLIRFDQIRTAPGPT